MEVGQAAISPWAWQTCGSHPVHSLLAGTSVGGWSDLSALEPIAGYCTATPDSTYRSHSVSSKSSAATTVLHEPLTVSPGATASSCPSSPPQNPPEAPLNRVRNQISAAEWATRRPEITELYRHRGWTLPRVMDEMTRRGFHASRKQYKTKITAWSLDKNFKRSELVAMLREKQRLEVTGQSCIFILSDRIVDMASLERASRRAKLVSTRRPQVLDHPSMLPSNIRCIPFPRTSRHAALPAPLTAPTVHETLRSLFHHTSVLFHSFFDRDVLTTTTRRDYSTLDTSLTTMNNALVALKRHEYHRAGELLDESFVALDAIVTSNHPNALSVVLKTVAACYRAGFAEVAAEVSRYVHALAEVRLQERDPRWVLFRMINELNIGGDDSSRTSSSSPISPSPQIIASPASPASRTSRTKRRKSQLRPSFSPQPQGQTSRVGKHLPALPTASTSGPGNSEVVSVYEVFCRDLWRRKRPGGGVLVLLWYPSLFCW